VIEILLIREICDTKHPAEAGCLLTFNHSFTADH